MTEEQFQHYASLGFNRVPLIAQARADLETPLSVYLKLARRSDTFLLESVVRGERGTQQFARYSYVGLAASTRLRAVGRHLVVERGGQVVETAEGDPLSFVRDYLKRFRVPERPELPRFKGGLVGYFGYDAVRWIEPRLAPGWLKKSGLDCPDLLLLLCEEVAVFDNFSGKLFLVVYADPARPGAYRDASHRLRELLALLSVPLIRACAGRIPLLGVCLGHQSIAAAFGGAIIRAQRPMHGKLCPVEHDGRGVFAGLPSPFTVTRYHSLVADPQTLPEALEVSARSPEGEIMGLRHRQYWVEGVQFHPEAVLSEHGEALMKNFLAAQAALRPGALQPA